MLTQHVLFNICSESAFGNRCRHRHVEAQTMLDENNAVPSPLRYEVENTTREVRHAKDDEHAHLQDYPRLVSAGRLSSQRGGCAARGPRDDRRTPRVPGPRPPSSPLPVESEEPSPPSMETVSYARGTAPPAVVPTTAAGPRESETATDLQITWAITDFLYTASPEWVRTLAR